MSFVKDYECVYLCVYVCVKSKECQIADCLTQRCTLIGWNCCHMTLWAHSVVLSFYCFLQFSCTVLTCSYSNVLLCGMMLCAHIRTLPGPISEHYQAHFNICLYQLTLEWGVEHLFYSIYKWKRVTDLLWTQQYMGQYQCIKPIIKTRKWNTTILWV